MVESRNEIFFITLESKDLHYGIRNIPIGVKIITGLKERSESDNPEKLFSLLPSFEKIINTISPDIIHAGPVQSCGFLTALIDFHPFILMSWGSDILVDANKNELLNWITRFTLMKSDRILCDCNAVRDKIQQIIAYDNEKIIQFPWGVNLKLFKPGSDLLKLKTKYGWENCFVILSTRMWEPLYGIDIVLKSFYIAYKTNPKLRLVILGDGSQAIEIKKFIREHNLEDIIILPGIISNDLLADYYRSVDAYISCSFSDGSSVSLLEAMASGLPVIVTDIPGNREWVINEKNGCLAALGNVQDFAAAIINICRKSCAEKQRISNNNRSIIERKANWEENILKLYHIYNQFGDD
jgi:glycosyltransferase involved in cell wall biosynthesis